jgi:hypothetical protein
MLTNTFKLVHKNEQNTNETSDLVLEEFHSLHALSLHIFIYKNSKKKLKSIKFSTTKKSQISTNFPK